MKPLVMLEPRERLAPPKTDAADAHPFRGVTPEWLPAPSLDVLARQRLIHVLVGLAVLHVGFAVAHVLDPAVWTLKAPPALANPQAFKFSAFIVALASAVFLAVSRFLAPRLPLRWGQGLAALVASLLALNALGLFAISPTPEKTIGVILAVIGAGLLLFCPRLLCLVVALAVGGWVGLARDAGFTPEWIRYGALLAAAAGLAFLVQNLQLQAIKQMLRGVSAPRANAQNSDAVPKAEDDERFRRWYEATFEGIALHERGLVLEANKALAALLQCEVSELTGKNLLDWFTRASRNLIEESILLGNFRPFEAVAVRRDKTEVHLELFSKRIPYRGREVMVTAFRDITERRRAAAAAEAEQVRLETQYRRQHALAQISMTSGDIEESARLLERVVQTITEVLPAHGGSVVIVFEDGTPALAAAHLPPIAREAALDPLAQLGRAAVWVQEHGKPYIAGNVSHDDPFAVSEPVEFISAYAAVPLHDGDRVAGVLFALETEQPRHFSPDDLDFLDALSTRASVILAKTRLCTELHSANDRLRAQSAMLQGQNEALAEAKSHAEQASAAKTEFLAKVSHELRTPLNGVIGMTDYLLTTELSADQRESAETIRASADLLLDQISRVLDFSQAETHIVGRHEPFVPSDLVRSVTDSLAGKAVSGVVVDAVVPVNCPTAFADVTALRRALHELITNAVKFTTSGRVTVECQVESVGTSSLDARFCVRDTGPGIDADSLAKLFEPFNQADDSDARAHQGLGLGLATARHLVQRMGGTIDVSSTPGRGSCFTIAIRFAQAPAGFAAPA